MKTILRGAGAIIAAFWWMMVVFLVVSVLVFGNVGGESSRHREPVPPCFIHGDC